MNNNMNSRDQQLASMGAFANSTNFTLINEALTDVPPVVECPVEGGTTMSKRNMNITRVSARNK